MTSFQSMYLSYLWDYQETIQAVDEGKILHMYYEGKILLMVLYNHENLEGI